MHSGNKLSYIQGLDGIRALSAFLVISAHWPNNLLSLKFGWIGVNIFFVLSGFLITRILLSTKDRPFISYIRSFYLKRALRIFPLYYLIIILVILFVFVAPILFTILTSIPGWHEIQDALSNNLPYYLTYTYNLKINLAPLFGLSVTADRYLGHLWSLCVEEQFYLIFPLLIYFLSKKKLKIMVICILLLCPIIRFFAVVIGPAFTQDKFWMGEFLYTNTLCQADALATGAALALFKIKLNKPVLTFGLLFGLWLAVGIIVFYFLRTAGYMHVEAKSLGYNFPGFWLEQTTQYFLVNIRPVYLYTLINLLGASLILPAIQGKPLFPLLFNNSLMSYFGKISYGIYIFHNPIITSSVLIMSLFGGWDKITANPVSEVITFTIVLTLIIATAHMSYQYFEKKLIHLKYKIE